MVSRNFFYSSECRTRTDQGATYVFRRLKAQVCHHRCPYRAGTASLKRPKTVRQHFEKVRFCCSSLFPPPFSQVADLLSVCSQCVFLEDQHPLKILSGLQLAVLERESQGLLPNRRKARAARLQSAGSPY